MRSSACCAPARWRSVRVNFRQRWRGRITVESATASTASEVAGGVSSSVIEPTRPSRTPPSAATPTAAARRPRAPGAGRRRLIARASWPVLGLILVGTHRLRPARSAIGAASAWTTSWVSRRRRYALAQFSGPAAPAAAPLAAGTFASRPHRPRTSSASPSLSSVSTSASNSASNGSSSRRALPGPRPRWRLRHQQRLGRFQRVHHLLAVDDEGLLAALRSDRRSPPARP